jgi:hypothetical protein
MYGRVYGDLFNVPRLLQPEVPLQIKFTKSKNVFFVVSTRVDTGTVFKFLDATLHVRHVKPWPSIQLAHAKALEKVNDRYDMTTAALKTLTFGAGSKSVSIDSAVLGTPPKHLLFAVLRNVDFMGSAALTPTYLDISGSTIF